MYIPEETYRSLFGLKKTKDLELVEDIVGALEKIDRALLPPPATHPLSGLIAGGGGQHRRARREGRVRRRAGAA